MDLIMDARGISKSYKNNVVLDDFNMKVYRGDVYGFVGKNGAGKTTFLRILLGLANANRGNISLFGSKDMRELYHNRKSISGIIEMPAFYSHMSADENLTAYCYLRGINKARIKPSLEKVGLYGVGRKKVGKFSLGMKQRLGIARAICGDSSFVILDEPTNGLDPNGIVEFRELIDRLNKENGITFIISSHYITELQKISTRFGLLANGQIMEEITAGELKQKTNSSLEIKLSDIALGLETLQLLFNDVHYNKHNDSILMSNENIDMGKIFASLSQKGIEVQDVKTTSSGAEEYILSVIGR